MVGMELAIGLVVYSRAGRDSGRKFIILEIIDKRYVFLVDGSLRNLEKPKKKKIKHIELTETIIYEVKDKIVGRKKLTNAEIRKHLEAH